MLKLDVLPDEHIVSLSKGNANVIEIKGASYTSPGLERTMGFRQIIDQYPGVKVISIDAKKDELPKDVFVNILKNAPKINYVYAYNDVIAYQAWKAAKGENSKNNIKFIGVDGLNGQVWRHSTCSGQNFWKRRFYIRQEGVKLSNWQ